MFYLMQLLSDACKSPEPRAPHRQVITISTVKIKESTRADTWRWGLPDFKIRLLPFFTIYAAAVLHSQHRQLLGFSLGNLKQQLLWGLSGAVIFFAGGMLVKYLLSVERKGMTVPATASDAAFEGLYYVINGPAEECFFRGFLQGTLMLFMSPAASFFLATATFVFYHRLGHDNWREVLSTALLGIPLGLAFWYMPEPRSLLGLSLAHIGGTCGFMGPGPYLLRRLGLLNRRCPALKSCS